MKETRDTISSQLVRTENVTTNQKQQSKSQVGLLLPHICIAVHEICCKKYYILKIKLQTVFLQKENYKTAHNKTKLQGYKCHHFKIEKMSKSQLIYHSFRTEHRGYYSTCPTSIRRAIMRVRCLQSLLHLLQKIFDFCLDTLYEVKNNLKIKGRNKFNCTRRELH